MPLLIDSDILIEVSRGRNQDILEFWQRLSDSDVVLMCSPISVAELWHGARPNEHATLNALFSALICVPIDREIGRAAGEYLKQYARSHSVELGDALIAATASAIDAELWTRNRKHYPMKDLRFR
jgi:predicted nucleic acid-binding protein